MTFDKNRLLTKWFLLCARVLSRRSRADFLRSGTTLCSFTWIAVIIPGLLAATIAFVVMTASAPRIGWFLGGVFLALLGLALCFGIVLGTVYGFLWLGCRSYDKHGIVFVIIEYGRAAKSRVCPLVKFK